MFDFDAGKLIVIGLVALIVIGPKELPRVLRQLGQAISKMRRMAGEFQGQFMDAMREAEIDEIRKDVTKMTDAAKIDVNFDPVQTVRNEIGGAIEGTTTGQVVATGMLLQGDTEIGINHLAPGLYLLQLQDASGMRSAHKVVKE